jgi:hypothetical protein
MPTSDDKAGDHLLDRYFPSTDPELREHARLALVAYGRQLLKLGTALGTSAEAKRRSQDDMLLEATSSPQPF